MTIAVDIFDKSVSTEAHVALWRAIRQGRLGTALNHVEPLPGRKPLGLEEWITENKAAFVA